MSDSIVDWGYQAPSLVTQDAINEISALILDYHWIILGQEGGKTLYKGSSSKQYRRAVSNIVTIVAR